MLDSIEIDLAADPKSKSKQPKGNWQGLWRYELRPYRVIFTILEEEGTILIVRIVYRKEVYLKP